MPQAAELDPSTYQPAEQTSGGDQPSGQTLPPTLDLSTYQPAPQQRKSPYDTGQYGDPTVKGDVSRLWKMIPDSWRQSIRESMQRYQQEKDAPGPPTGFIGGGPIPGTEGMRSQKAWDVATGNRLPFEPQQGQQPQDHALDPIDASSTSVFKAFPDNQELAKWVIGEEGGRSSGPAQRNNNPGNLKDPSTKTFATFPSPEEGMNALLRQLDHWRQTHPNWSVEKFNRAYAPDKSNGGDNPDGTEEGRNQRMMQYIRKRGGQTGKEKVSPGMSQAMQQMGSGQWQQPAAQPQTADQVPGMLVPGNIDLSNRPIVRNDDGSISTEFSTSFGDDKGREVLVPTVVGGKFLTPDGKKPPEGSAEEKAMFKRAQQHYEQTGEHMGIFDTPEHADAYAKQVHERSGDRSGATYRMQGEGPVTVYQPESDPEVQGPMMPRRPGAGVPKPAAPAMQEVYELTGKVREPLTPQVVQAIEDTAVGLGRDPWTLLKAAVQGGAESLRAMTGGQGRYPLGRTDPEKILESGAKTGLAMAGFPEAEETQTARTQPRPDAEVPLEQRPWQQRQTQYTSGKGPEEEGDQFTGSTAGTEDWRQVQQTQREQEAEAFTQRRVQYQRMRQEPPAELGGGSRPQAKASGAQGEALAGESAVRNELANRDIDTLTNIAQRRGIDISEETKLNAHDAAPRIIEKIMGSLTDEETEEMRSFAGSRSPLKKQTPPVTRTPRAAKPKPRMRFETTPIPSRGTPGVEFAVEPGDSMEEWVRQRGGTTTRDPREATMRWDQRQGRWVSKYGPEQDQAPMTREEMLTQRLRKSGEAGPEFPSGRFTSMQGDIEGYHGKDIFLGERVKADDPVSRFVDKLWSYGAKARKLERPARMVGEMGRALHSQKKEEKK
jgi:hypothetical protein